MVRGSRSAAYAQAVPTFSVVPTEDNQNAERPAAERSAHVEVPRLYDEEPVRRKVEELDVPDFLK
ncbi:hypothetical protein NKG05_00195 [Oerskovia sp. M15]